MSDMSKCKAPGCTKDADYEVILYDVYPYNTVFFKRDFTCPYLCEEHVMENEREAKTYEHRKELEGKTTSFKELLHTDFNLIPAESERRYRGSYQYPFTNREGAQGFTVYRPLN